MKNILMSAGRSLVVGALLFSAASVRADPGDTTGHSPMDSARDKAADNTGRNQQTRQAGEPTAEQQKNTRSDLETTRLIRRAVVTDKSLSIYAHNVKIIAQNGSVILKGPVRTEEEKQLIEKKAAEIAGAANVQNQLEVAPKK